MLAHLFSADLNNKLHISFTDILFYHEFSFVKSNHTRV
jgi:hypothetical protein